MFDPIPFHAVSLEDGHPRPRRARLPRSALLLPPRLLAGFLAAALSVLAIMIISVQSHAQRLQAGEWVTHSYDVLQRLDAVLGMISSAESAQRGYLLTGAENQLRIFQALREQLPPALAELRVLTAYDAVQQREIDHLEGLSHARLQRLEINISLQQQGQRAAVELRVQSGEGSQQMEAIRNLVAELDTDERRRLQHRTDAWYRVGRYGLVIALIGCAVLLVLILSAASLVARELRGHEQAARTRDEFLAIASHELKTPLTSLGLQLDLMEKALPAPGGGQATARLEKSQRQVRRLDALIRSLLDTSRISSGELELHYEELDVAPVLRELADGLTDEFARAGSALKVDIAPLPGRWDPVRLEQMVGNLLANAAKYGTGKPVELTARVEGDSGIITVRDYGIGIAPTDLKRIFGKFERAASRNYGGLGLGLYVVRNVAEAMGGTVSVESRPGESTTFTLKLPRDGRKQA